MCCPQRNQYDALAYSDPVTGLAKLRLSTTGLVYVNVYETSPDTASFPPHSYYFKVCVNA